jgi:hypothetical protein
MGDLAKVLKPVTKVAKALDPPLALALTALSIYGTFKSIQGLSSKDRIEQEKESWDRQLQWSDEARQTAERDNRARRVYDHLGFNPYTKYYPGILPEYAAERKASSDI